MKEKTIKVRVSAGAKTEKIEEIAPGSFKVRVHVPPEKGRANVRVAQLLAGHFKVPVAKVTLLNGAKFREKVFLVKV